MHLLVSLIEIRSKRGPRTLSCALCLQFNRKLCHSCFMPIILTKTGLNVCLIVGVYNGVSSKFEVCVTTSFTMLTLRNVNTTLHSSVDAIKIGVEFSYQKLFSSVKFFSAPNLFETCKFYGIHTIHPRKY